MTEPTEKPSVRRFSWWIVTIGAAVLVYALAMMLRRM